MMNEIEQVDHAASEPYQREVQYIVDAFKVRKEERMNKLNLLKSQPKALDKNVSLDTDPNQTVAIDMVR